MLDVDALVVRRLDSLFAEAAPHAVTMAHSANDLDQAVCGLAAGARANAGLVVFRPNASEFGHLVPRFLREIECGRRQGHSSHAPLLGPLPNGSLGGAPGAVAGSCYRNEQTALACYHHERRELRTLPCQGFFDPGLFLQGRGSFHHKRCRRMRRMDGVARGEVGSACDGLARLVDAQCGWEGARVDAIHFKGKSKPWRGIYPRCANITLGRLRLVTPATPHGTPLQLWQRPALHWQGRPHWQCRVSLGEGAHRPDELDKRRGYMQGHVAYANGQPLDKTCCKSNVWLGKGEWYETAAEARLPFHPIEPGMGCCLYNEDEDKRTRMRRRRGAGLDRE